jgi:hypothetical protein
MSTSELEARLRAALQARSDAVTTAKLTRPAIVADTPLTAAEPVEVVGDSEVTRLDTEVVDLHAVHNARRPHSKLFAPLLAAAAVIVLALGAVAIANSHGQHRPGPVPPASHVSSPIPSSSPSVPASSKPSTSHTVVAAPPALGHGQEGTRSQIPWSKVGAGWTVALWSASSDSTNTGTAAHDQPENFYLINPAGGRYLVAGIPAEDDLLLDDWSGDGYRAIFTDQKNGFAPVKLLQLDLRTGVLAQIAVPGKGAFIAQYTRPLGKAILLSTERIDLAGNRQLAYPTTVPGLGKLYAEPLYSPDGTTLIWGSEKGMAVLANDGTVLRTIPAPADADFCRPMRWWSDNIAVMRCDSISHRTTNVVFLAHVGTGEPSTPLAGVSFGQAWNLVSGPIAITDGGDCGAIRRLATLDGGIATNLSLPAAIDNQHLMAIGATRTSLDLVVSQPQDCQSHALVSYDPGANSVISLLGTGVNGGSIIGAVGYHATDPVR